MKLQLFILILILLIIHNGCQKKHTYYYSIDGKSKMEIEAISDSAAYMQAFVNFHITRKIYRDEKAFYPNVKRKEPVYFTLYNKQEKDITNSVNFLQKDSLEKNAIKRIFRLKNIFLDDAEKSKEIN
jgi:hypothetical protein